MKILRNYVVFVEECLWFDLMRISSMSTLKLANKTLNKRKSSYNKNQVFFYFQIYKYLINKKYHFKKK